MKIRIARKILKNQRYQFFHPHLFNKALKRCGIMPGYRRVTNSLIERIEALIQCEPMSFWIQNPRMIGKMTADN